MGGYMAQKKAQKKKQTAAGASALAQPQIVANAAAVNTSESAATAAGAATPAHVPGAAGVGGTGLLTLGASLSIREVGERAAQFTALIATGSAEVDAGKLESIDTAGLQLLLAAAAAARRRGLTLRLHGAGSLNSGAASALGLADHLAATAKILP
jgi:ABC-type transporter Mla MlaB component